jgi:hypothetical protein
MRTTTASTALAASLSLVSSSIVSAGCELEFCVETPTLTPVGDASSPIIDGQVDETNRSSVALLITNPNGRRAICSGTVVAVSGSTGYVLTAAHCVDGSVTAVLEATDWQDCTSQGDPTGCNAAYTPTGWIVHEGYDPATFDNDFAIVTFEGATQATPVTPVVDEPDGLVLGDTVTISGFGRTYAGESDPGAFQSLRHSAQVDVARLSDPWIGLDATLGPTACFGDSGGPAYATIGGRTRVVGVASNADGRCEVLSNYSRVSLVYDSFIAPNLPEECVDCGAGGAGGAGGGAGTGGGEGGGGSSGDGGAGGSSSDGGSSSSGAGSTGEGASSSSGGGSDDEFTYETTCRPATLGCAISELEESRTSRSSGWLAASAAILVALRRSRRTRAR